MPRISVVEQYDNKDLIQQIYRLKDLVETGTASNIAVTDNHDGTITVDVTMRDGTIQTFTLANDNIATIAAVQNGADVTVTVTFESGSTQSFTFNVASGKVDVLTTAGSYVYTHTGATQNEQQYAINAVAGAIMQRDASGQVEVKSPASNTDSDYVVNIAKLNARLTDGSVTKIGTSNVGSDTKPIKLVAGVPTVITNDLVDLPSAQAITGAKTVPLETTGVFSNQIASSNKVKNELDNYAPMVRTTGNQSIAGNKTFTGSVASTTVLQAATSGNSPTIQVKYMIADNTDSNIYYYPSIAFLDRNDDRAARLTVTKHPNGRCVFTVHVRNADGTYKAVDLAAGDV